MIRWQFVGSLVAAYKERCHTFLCVLQYANSRVSHCVCVRLRAHVCACIQRL